MSQCRIYLENYTGTYHAGSEIRGSLQCYFEDETTLRGIKVRLICKEYNEWTGTETYRDERDNNREKTRSVNLTGENNVIYNEQMLFGSDSGNQMLGKGQHVYPFLYNLPLDVPSTFKGPYGSISYLLQAIVDRPMAVDFEDKFIFAVISTIDLNRMPRELQNPSTYSDQKAICCLCCAGGNLSLVVELPKIAYVPGETVPFKVHVRNSSNSNMENLHIKFIKTLTFTANSPTIEKKTVNEDILSFTENGVGAHADHTFDLSLAIPSQLEVPNFTGCNLFRVGYNLHVECVLPAWTMNLKVAVWDVYMGHVQWVSGGPGARPSSVGAGGDAPKRPVQTYDTPPPVVYPPPPGGIYPVLGGPLPPHNGGGVDPYGGAPPTLSSPSYNQIEGRHQTPLPPQ